MDSTPAPKQTKLLGATIRGVGLVVAVSTRTSDAYALIEDEHGVIHYHFLRDLTREDAVFPPTAYAYATQIERVGYGVWDEIFCLIPAVQVAWEVAA